MFSPGGSVRRRGSIARRDITVAGAFRWTGPGVLSSAALPKHVPEGENHRRLGPQSPQTDAARRQGRVGHERAPRPLGRHRAHRQDHRPRLHLHRLPAFAVHGRDRRPHRSGGPRRRHRAAGARAQLRRSRHPGAARQRRHRHRLPRRQQRGRGAARGRPREVPAAGQTLGRRRLPDLRFQAAQHRRSGARAAGEHAGGVHDRDAGRAGQTSRRSPRSTAST